MLNRRGTLKLGAAGGVALALPAFGSSSAATAFTVPLPVPPVLSPVRSDLSTDYCEMSIQSGVAEILPGVLQSLLDRNGVPVPSWEAYPKDTVSIRSGETARLQVKFEAPFLGIYPFHGHFVDHSSIAMMAQMEVIA